MPLFTKVEFKPNGFTKELEPIDPGQGWYMVSGQPGKGQMLLAVCDENDMGGRVYMLDVVEEHITVDESGKRSFEKPTEDNLIASIVPLFYCVVEFVDADGDEWELTFQHQDQKGSRYCPN